MGLLQSCTKLSTYSIIIPVKITFELHICAKKFRYKFVIKFYSKLYEINEICSLNENCLYNSCEWINIVIKKYRDPHQRCSCCLAILSTGNQFVAKQPSLHTLKLGKHWLRAIPCTIMCPYRTIANFRSTKIYTAINEKQENLSVKIKCHAIIRIYLWKSMDNPYKIGYTVHLRA